MGCPNGNLVSQDWGIQDRSSQDRSSQASSSQDRSSQNRSSYYRPIQDSAINDRFGQIKLDRSS